MAEFPFTPNTQIWPSLKRHKWLIMPITVLIVLVIFRRPIWTYLTQIKYGDIASSISHLNAPEKVKQILLFLVGYNVYILLCGCFGASVGASEILSRNRDEPFLAVVSPPGLYYLAVNAGISIIAFYLLHHFSDSIMPGVMKDPLLASVAAGFGAMIVMRARILNFKNDGGEATGPDSVISNFLTSINMQIVRYRASQRQRTVYFETQKVIDPRTAPDFLLTFLISYQDLTNEERAIIGGEIKRIYQDSELGSARLKFMAVAFGLLNVVGQKNFRALMEQLSNYQQLVIEPPPQPPPQEVASGQPPAPAFIAAKIDQTRPVSSPVDPAPTIPTPAATETSGNGPTTGISIEGALVNKSNGESVPPIGDTGARAR